MILFGSVARGQAKEHSDIDIIVVASGLPELRMRAVLPLSQAGPNSVYLDDAGGAGGYGNGKDGIPVDALLEGRVLQDDGTVAAALRLGKSW